MVGGLILATLLTLFVVPAFYYSLERVSQRTKAGMARAKAAGARIDRPRIAPEVREEITSRLATGASVYRVATELEVDRHTVRKYGEDPRACVR